MPFLFEDFALDADRRELRHKEALVTVEPQVFDLLIYLLRNRNRVVSKDDLLSAVWEGRIVSESTLTSRINAARRAVGDTGKAQRLIRTVPRKGIRFVGEVHDKEEPAASTPAATRNQEVTFCRAHDGVNLAVASVGEGTPLVKAANWLTHIEYDWESPIWSPLLHHLAERNRLIRYDGRGHGLSDREAADISFASFERDLESVIDATRVERPAILGISQGAAVAVAYAVRHPDRVSKLVLYGGYAQGRNKRSEADAEMGKAFLAIMRHGWGEEHSAFMRAFCSVFIPNGTPEQTRWFADLQRMTASAENAMRIRMACDNIDVTALLPQVRVPTLVLHCRYDNVAPFAQGRLMAASIPNAKFVTLESENHVVLAGEPAWPRLLGEIDGFLSQ